MDVLTKSQRSFCMSQIKGKDTKPEITLRKSLWNLGYRYRVRNKLPGKPDIIFPGLRAVIFVDGCFWHKCPEHYQPPITRADFWDKKITGNVERDKKNNSLLKAEGWLVLRVWEHEVKQNLNDCLIRLCEKLSERKVAIKHQARV